MNKIIREIGILRAKCDAEGNEKIRNIYNRVIARLSADLALLQ